jgi:hypothetical protein
MTPPGGPLNKAAPQFMLRKPAAEYG